MAASLVVFLALGAHQLQLPGLHYDEAREAGLNAMELVTWQPLTAFRDAAVQVGPWRLPLMVQDYIGALNVLLATPFLALGGVNVLSLRLLPLLLGAGTLLLVWQTGRELGGTHAATASTVLLAANPSWVLWSRQGIFVTNLTALLLMASLLTWIRWFRQRKTRHLVTTALLWGLGLYAKLSFVWAILAMLVMTLILLAPELRRLHVRSDQPAELRPRRNLFVAAGLGLLCFLTPLYPLFLFNLRTGGTWSSLVGNLSRSYYGVDNSAFLDNLATRLGQVVSLLRGEQFWYLGGVFANALAPWLAAALVGAATIVTVRRRDSWQWAVPIGLVTLIVVQSAFTVSDLFITHYVFLLPLLPLCGGLAISRLWDWSQTRGAHSWRISPAWRAVVAGLVLLAMIGWASCDLWTTLRYHKALASTGGLASHSDGVYELARYLDESGIAAPLALDWGMDAQLRYLTAGRVRPIEVFGYANLTAPDDGFQARLASFVEEPNNIYLAHAPGQVVFDGRVAALSALAEEDGLRLEPVRSIAERSGQPLFLLYRVRGSSGD